MPRTFQRIYTKLFGFSLFVSLAGGAAAYGVARVLDPRAPASLAWVLGLVVGGATLLTGAVGAAFVRGLLSSARQVMEGIRFVLQGRYEKRLPVRQRDELGDLAEAFNRMVQRLQERERARRAMDKVVSPEVAQELLSGEMRLGGEIRFATVLFADIRGFTGISESLDPRQLVGFLNAHLTRLSALVEKNNGVIDKYIGDGVMALFGAPVSRDDDVDNGLQTALDFLWEINQENYRRSWEGKAPIALSVGLNTGPVVAGNMGSEDRLNYTVLGDSVNLASRMEGLTRIYNVNCVVSEFTQRESRKNFLFRELDLVKVKGRSTAVRIFELWDGDQNLNNVSEMFQKFQRARQYYILREWDRAETLFRQVLEMRPGDGPSRLYLSRLKELKERPPSDAWDGIYLALQK